MAKKPSYLSHQFQPKKPLFYPRAHEGRLSINDPSVIGLRKAFVKAAGINFVLLQILFLALFSYIFGAIYLQNTHTHNLKILYVDYDNGLVGTSIRNAYKKLQGDAFPTLVEKTAAEFPNPGDLREDVCKAHHWAALYTSPGASDRLQTALLDGSVDYDKNNIMSYVWNEAVYSTIADSAISANLQTLSRAAGIAYAASDWTSITNASTATFSTFADPWQLTSVNIQVTTQGARLIYNTLVIILILVQEFFYLGTINSLYEAFGIYRLLNPHRIFLYRFTISALYTMVGSLCVVGTIWAFRDGWHVQGTQFVLSWMILWIFAHVNFLTLDVFSVWLPPPYVPMALIAWIVFNVTTVLIPFALSPAFYRWGYVMPAHEVYQVLVDIWSGGCNPKLSYALPVLFVLELSGIILSYLGVHRRAHYAVIKQEEADAAFQTRVDAYLKVEKEERAAGEREAEAGRTRSSEIDTTSEKRQEGSRPAGEEVEEGSQVRDEEEAADALRQTDSRIRRMQSYPSGNANFGPSFGFAFGQSKTADKNE